MLTLMTKSKIIRIIHKSSGATLVLQWVRGQDEQQ